MARILSSDIWWADLNPVRGRVQAGKRPVLIISQGVFNARSGTVIALALTTQAPSAGFPLTLALTSPSFPQIRGSKSARFAHFRLNGWTTKLARSAQKNLHSSLMASMKSSVINGWTRTRW